MKEKVKVLLLVYEVYIYFFCEFIFRISVIKSLQFYRRCLIGYYLFIKLEKSKKVDNVECCKKKNCFFICD